jgi:hypothetical protein
MANLRGDGRAPLGSGLMVGDEQYAACPRRFVYTGHVSDQRLLEESNTDLIILESDRVDRKVPRCFRVPREPRRRRCDRMLLLKPLVSDQSALLTIAQEEPAYSIVHGALPCSRKSRLSPTHRSLVWVTGTILADSTTSTVVVNRSVSWTICSQSEISEIEVMDTSYRPISFAVSGTSSVHSFEFVVTVCETTLFDAGFRIARLIVNGAAPSRRILASDLSGWSRHKGRVLDLMNEAEGLE